MTKKDYAVSFVRSTLGLPSDPLIEATNADVSTIAEHLSGRLSTQSTLDLPVNSVLKNFVDTSFMSVWARPNVSTKGVVAGGQGLPLHWHTTLTGSPHHCGMSSGSEGGFQLR